jgi:LPS sulfotransferase NodH
MVAAAWLALAIVSRTRPQRFLLFTTQRSGSFWTEQLLDSSPAIHCADELILTYTRARGLPDTFQGSWTEWVRIAEGAFVDAENSSENGTEAIGFKLMYNQVHAARLIPDNMSLPFRAWLINRRIKVVHLAREASLLQYASTQEVRAREVRVYHTHNSSLRHLARVELAAASRPIPHHPCLRLAGSED